MKQKIKIIMTSLMLTGGLLTSAFGMELGGIDIHGFISQGFIMSDEYHYLTHDSKDGSFQYNEMGINFSKELTDNLRLGVQLFSRDLGDAANNKITLDWAYGDYRFKDWLGIRAGRIKLPLGFYNETRDIDLLRTAIVMPQSVYCDLMRDSQIAANGVSFYGNVDLSDAGSIDYQAIAGQINVDKDSGMKKWFDARFLPVGLSLIGNPEPEMSWVGALRWNTPIDGWVLGGSVMKMDSDNPILVSGAISTIQATENTMLTLSTEYTWNDLVLAAEYQTFESISDIEDNHLDKTSQGYYISASYRFTDIISVGTYYSVFYLDEDDKDGDAIEALYSLPKSDAWEKDLALTLRLDFNDYTVFKIEGHMVDGTARVNRVDNPVISEEDFYYGVAKITFSF